MKKQLHSHHQSLLFVLFALFSIAVKAQVVNTEGFESVTWPPAGWSAIGSNSNWASLTAGTFPAASPHSGSRMARYNSRTSPPGNAQSFASPAFDLSSIGTDTARFSFWIYRNDSLPTSQDRISIFINTTKSLTGATLLGDVARSISLALPDVQLSNGWYQYTFDVPSGINNDTNYILIRGTTDHAGLGSGSNIFIDDVTYTSFPTSCTGSPTAGTIVPTDTIICGGTGSTTLVLSGQSSDAGISVQWKSGPTSTGPWTDFGTSTSSVSTGTITSTTYYYSVLTCANSGLSDSTPVVQVSVSANANPVVNVTGSNSGNYCAGIPVLLVATGANSYTWSPAGSLDVSSGDSVHASPAGAPGATVTYTAIGYDLSGCSGRDSLTVTVHSTTTVNITINPNDTVCLGQQVVLNAVSGGGPALTSYLWLPGNQTTQSITFAPTVDSSYIVVARNTFGCPSSDTVSIHIITGSVPVITSVTETNNGLYCVGQDSVTLVVSGTGSVSTNWTPATGLDFTTRDTVHSAPPFGGGSTLYTVTLTSASGCSASDTIRVRRSNPPGVNIQVTPNDTICAGDSLTLFAQVGAPNDTFLWSPGGETTQTIVVAPASSQDYIVHVISGVSGCPNNDTVSITALTAPVAMFTYSISGLTVTFTNTSTDGITYAWDFGDLSSSTAQNPPPHIYSGFGPYDVTLVASNGNCVDTVTVSVDLTVGIHEIKGDNGITILQNNSKGVVTVQFNSLQGDMLLQVVNAVGQVMTQRKVVSQGNRNNNEEIDISSFPSGIYSIQIMSPSKNYSKKIIKM